VREILKTVVDLPSRKVLVETTGGFPNGIVAVKPTEPIEASRTLWSRRVGAAETAVQAHHEVVAQLRRGDLTIG
jgi:hypothetical protein